MVTGTTTFLGSATERLLPAHIPFRFFAAAVLFHVLAWAVLALNAEQMLDYAGGGGPVLAAIHLVTLGVFVMTAMGASLQLLPVATLQGFGAPKAISVVWWLQTAGTICLTVGMYDIWPLAMTLGGAMVTLAIVLYLCLLVGNLRHGGTMTIVVAHGWLAAGALVGLLILGLMLIANQQSGYLENSQRAGISHMLLAAYGFMGLLAIGFAYILVPMFALAPAPRAGWPLIALVCGCAGLLLAIAGTWQGRDDWAAIGGMAGLVGAFIHVGLMELTLHRRLRKRLGPAFMLIRLSWILLPLSLLLGTATALDLLPDWGGMLFSLSIFGWLLSLLFAIMQRIVPFLASLHAATTIKRRPPTVTALTAQHPLTVHFYCHCAALALLAIGLIWSQSWLLALGAAMAFAGAVAFAWFFTLAMTRFKFAMSAPAS